MPLTPAPGRLDRTGAASPSVLPDASGAVAPLGAAAAPGSVFASASLLMRVLPSALTTKTVAPFRSLRCLSILLVILLAVVLCVGCTAEGDETGTRTLLDATVAVEAEGESVIQKISADEAREMMTSNEVAVLDVRTPEEYAERHIVNARLLTLDTIGEATATEAAPNKEAPVFVYCRSGVRSAEAARKLEALGYRKIYDFGGIMDWPYATVDGEAPTESGLPEGELPVGVKVVCGKTKAAPSAD